MLSAESVVTADISRKLKDDFSFVNLESIERRFRRFFLSFSSIAYIFYDALIKYVISLFCVKHSDNKIHISFDHMFCKDKFTILLFSLRVGKQGIPIWFRCFKGNHNPLAYDFSLIKEGISYCADLFSNKNYHIIFLADRWFPHVDILSHIESIGCFYCIRSKSFFTVSYTNSKGRLVTSHLRDIRPLKYKGKVLSNVFILEKCLKLILLCLIILILFLLGILLLMMILHVLLGIILIALVLLSLSLNLRNPMVLGLKVLILKRLSISSLFLQLCVSLFFG